MLALAGPVTALSVGGDGAAGPRSCRSSDEQRAVSNVAKSLAPAMRALADENRLTILALLADHPLTVVELTKALNISQTLVSHHLKALRDSGMVTAVPEGRSNRYSLCCHALAEPMRFLNAIAESDRGTEE